MGYREIKRIRKDIRELRKDNIVTTMFVIIFCFWGFILIGCGKFHIGIFLIYLSSLLFSIYTSTLVKIGRLKSNIHIIKKFEREIRNLKEQVKK